jgi:hypothetical protein
LRNWSAVQYHSGQQRIFFCICEDFPALAGIANGMQGPSVQGDNSKRKSACRKILKGVKHGHQET